ncbi:hypothetical protein Q5530_16330 [Saccharothrix sp. BKS2]
MQAGRDFVFVLDDLRMAVHEPTTIAGDPSAVVIRCAGRRISRPVASGRVGVEVLLWAEVQLWDVVEVGVAAAQQCGAGDLDDEHLGEELDLCSQQVAGAAGGAAFLEADRDVDVGVDLVVGLVEGEGAATEGFDVGQVDFRPDRCFGVGQLFAGADDVDVAEAGDEAGDVGVADMVLCAELGQCGEEVVAVVEGDAEAAAEGQFVAADDGLLIGSRSSGRVGRRLRRRARRIGWRCGRRW